MIFHGFGQVLLLLTPLADAAEKGIMRRHKALMVNADGDVLDLQWHISDRSEMPVENHSYQVAFEMDGQVMCWQRETEGCRQFAGDCEIKYCQPETCDCMLVRPMNCGDHVDLFTEADWDKDPTSPGALSTKFWRGIRVQYYDPSKWGGNVTVDVGKALETSLSCMDEAGCSCHESRWFHWSYPQFGGNLEWTPAGNLTGETIGPSGHTGLRLQQSIVVRIYNDAGQASNMYFVPEATPLSLRSTTTTTIATTSSTVTTAATTTAAPETTEEEEEEEEEVTTETETTVTTTTTIVTTTTLTTTSTTTTVTTSTTTVTTTTSSSSTTTTTTEYLAPEYGEAAFQQAQEAGMSEAQSAEIAAGAAGLATQIAKGSGQTWPLLKASALSAGRAAFAAGKAAGMDTATGREAACSAAGAAAAQLKWAQGSTKRAVRTVARWAARKTAQNFGMTSEAITAAGQNAEGHASARVAGVEAQKAAMAARKSWWSVAMAAATAASEDAFESKELRFTAAEVAAAAAGAATAQVMQQLQRPRHKVIKVAGLVAKKAGLRRGMTRAEADFAGARAAALASVTTDPTLPTMFPTTTSTTTTPTTSTTSTTTTSSSTTPSEVGSTLEDEEDPSLDE